MWLLKNMKSLYLIPAIIILLIAVTSCANETVPVDYTSLDSLIENTALSYIDENNIKGISIGFIDVGNYRTEKGFGNTDASTFFPMASVTKVITAAAIMQLVQDGMLELDDKLSDYLPGFDLKKPHPDSPGIKIRDILTHSSGLSRDIMSLAQGNCPVGENEILEYINNHPQISPAGYRHLYSNPGFDLLALVIENVSGLPYPVYAKENILEPLNMKSSFFYNPPEDIELTRSYTMFSEEAYEEMPINYIAAGGLKSNVTEMLHFAEMLLMQSSKTGKMVLEDTSLDKMFSRQNSGVLLDTDINMGVSVFLEELPPPFTGKLVYHGGGAVFTNTMMLLAPDYGIGVVVFCNTAGSYHLVEQLARSMIHEALEIKTGQSFNPMEHQTPGEASWQVAERERITGDYFTSNNIISIKEERDSVIAIIGENRFPVKYFEDGFFSYFDGFILKVEEIEGERILFSLSNGLLTPIAKHKDAVTVIIPESWKQAAGTYVSVTPCPDGAVKFYESLRIYVRDNNLYLGMLPEKIVRETYGITSEIPALLTPLDETTAAMQDFGRYGAEPVFFNSDDNTLRFSGLTFKRAD